MKQVPLSGRVIFSDWHGVLSRDPFWVSIHSSATHPLHRQLEAGLAGVFAGDRDTANQWMKGLLSAGQVIAGMGIQPDRRFREDFLARRLDIDCARMKINAELFEVRADNCAAFTGQGGTAIRWKLGTDDVSDAVSQLKRWLDAGIQDRPHP